MRTLTAMTLMFGWLTLVCGCGPSAAELREKTLSTLNTEADAWDGGPDFKTAAVDAYDRPLIAKVTKGLLNNNLELRSYGRDGLPKNSDDLVVHRHKAHGGTTVNKEIEQASESIGRGGVRGAIQGAKEAIAGKGADAQPKMK